VTDKSEASGAKPAPAAPPLRPARKPPAKAAPTAAPPEPHSFDVLVRTAAGQRVVAGLMHLLFETSRIVGRRAAARFASDFLREFGPFVGEHALAAANLAAAFPEKLPEERAHILSGVWDNLARATIDYAFMKELVASFDPDRPTGGQIEHVGIEDVYRLRDGGKAGIIFGAHYGNWELSAAIGRSLGVPITALYRPPRNPFVGAELERRRYFVEKLVASNRGAALQVAGALMRGSHIGVIIDQRISEGPLIPFFGRPAHSNPIVGLLARHFECPVHGARSIRLPGGRFLAEFSPPLELPRDEKGRVDADATNRLVHGIVESWVRERPEQWLWVHDRWRQ
jgi:Kdo2-lipid IVA lauroyltransferase/acyltransferase